MTSPTRRTSTEAFVQFLEFNRKFNRQFKVSVAAIMHVSRIVVGEGGTRIMQGLIADTGEPWPKDFNWATPAADLAAALRDTSLLGVVQVDSAIDDLLADLRADLASWRAAVGVEEPHPERLDEFAEPLEAFYITAVGGDPADFDRLRPILRYFRLARNCIAHRSGLASPAFAETSSDPLVNASLETWPTRNERALPTLPAFRSNEPVELQPRHAILFLQAAYDGAVLVNRRTVKVLGSRGVAYLAARHALFGDTPLDGLSAYRSPQAVISDALSNRYRLNTKGTAAIQLLKPLGVWKDCIAAFERRFGSPPKPLAMREPIGRSNRSSNRPPRSR